MKTIYVYLDETGKFEKAAEPECIGGFYTETEPTETQLERFWSQVTGREKLQSYHAKNEKGWKEHFAQALPLMKQLAWHPLVFRHESQRFVVDNPTTYVYAMAEGLTRFGQQLMRGGHGEIHLEIIAASRSVPTEHGKEQMTWSLYEERIRAQVECERVRSPRYASELSWTWRLILRDAVWHPALMVADLVCYAWRNARHLDPVVRAKWQDTYEPKLFDVLQTSDLERVRLLVEREEYGTALVDLLILLLGEQGARAEESLRLLLDRVARLSGRAREAILQVPLSRLETQVAARAALADRAVEMFVRRVLEPLRERLPADDSADLEVACLWAESIRLACANHRGALATADAALGRMRPLLQCVSSRFEHLPLAFEAHVVEGVHQTNAYQFETTMQTMTTLGDRIVEVMSFFAQLSGSGSEVRSDVVGKAYGTALQAAIYGGRRAPALFDEARRLSDLAIESFVGKDDKRRQYGYRAQLETDAGCLAEASRWLRETLGLSAGAHWEAVARAAGTEASNRNPFPLMHYARLWEAAARLGETSVVASLGAAWTTAGLDEEDRWSKAFIHPFGLALWKWGAALGYSGSPPPRAAVDRLKAAIGGLEASADGITLLTLGLGARADLAAVLALRGGGPGYDAQVKEIRTCLERLAGGPAPVSVKAWFAGWMSTMAGFRDLNEPVERAQAWRALARDVPY